MRPTLPQHDQIAELDVVRTRNDHPDQKVTTEMTGTVVMLFDDGAMVEYSDDLGQTQVMGEFALDELVLVWQAPKNHSSQQAAG